MKFITLLLQTPSEQEENKFSILKFQTDGNVSSKSQECVLTLSDQSSPYRPKTFRRFVFRFSRIRIYHQPVESLIHKAHPAAALNSHEEV